MIIINFFEYDFKNIFMYNLIIELKPNEQDTSVYPQGRLYNNC